MKSKKRQKVISRPFVTKGTKIGTYKSPELYEHFKELGAWRRASARSTLLFD